MDSDDEYEAYFKPHEPPEQWRLRKMFLKRYKDRLEQDELEVKLY